MKVGFLVQLIFTGEDFVLSEVDSNLIQSFSFSILAYDVLVRYAYIQV